MALALLSLTLLLIAGAYTSHERDQWVDHTLEVLQQLERYESSVLAIQVLTGANSLEPTSGKALEASLNSADHAVSQLLRLTLDNPRQSIRARVLKSLTTQIAERLRARLHTPPMIGLPAQNVWADGPIADTIKEMRKDERMLLADRQQARASANNSFWIFTAIALTSNLLIVGWAYLASRRYVTERNLTELEIRKLNTRLADQVTAIRALNASLEDRVAAKTSELESMVAKLKSTNHELERFAYVASHDMQEPLRQVVSFNNLLALKYAERLDETANRYLEYSVSGAKRLQLMLRGLLQYTITTPASVYRSDIPVDLLMRGVLQDLQPEIDSATAEVDIEADLGLSIIGDRDMIRVLALALVSNAIKFRDHDSPPRVSVAFDRLTDRWSMTVTDNGIGIEERFIPRVFEMFARFHPVGQYQGAGVGLALSKKIVDCHGGKFDVRANALGRGTRFTVEIPILSPDHKNGLETGRFPY